MTAKSVTLKKAKYDWIFPISWFGINLQDKYLQRRFVEYIKSERSVISKQIKKSTGNFPIKAALFIVIISQENRNELVPVEVY